MRAIDENPGVPDGALARHVADTAGEPALMSFALERIEHVIRGERRKRTRQVEIANTAGHVEYSGRWSAVDALLEEYRKAVIVDWTNELLAAEFALGDGVRVTWGNATAQQHATRIVLLRQNVRGNLDTIQRHEAAIAAITEKGVASLSEAVKRA
jgi:hypothetical protein